MIFRNDRRQAHSGRAPRRGGGRPIFIPIPSTWGPRNSPWSGSSGGFSGGGGSFGCGGASGSFLLGRTNGIYRTAPQRSVGEGIISDVDKQHIVAAIHAAEEKTAGQILCVIAGTCGGYRLVPIAWAAIVSFAVPLALIFLTAWPAAVIYVIQLAAFIATALVLSLPMFRFASCPSNGCRDGSTPRRCANSCNRAFTSRRSEPIY